MLRIIVVKFASQLESWLIGRWEAHALFLVRPCCSLLIQALPSWSSWISTTYFCGTSYQLNVILVSIVWSKFIASHSSTESNFISSNSSFTLLFYRWHRLYFSMFIKRKCLCVCLVDSMDSFAILCHSSDFFSESFRYPLCNLWNFYKIYQGSM